jgi:hypothetical protein
MRLEPLEDLRPVIGRRGAARERRAETPVHPADRQRWVGDKVVEQGGDEVVAERLDTRVEADLAPQRQGGGQARALDEQDATQALGSLMGGCPDRRGSSAAVPA